MNHDENFECWSGEEKYWQWIEWDGLERYLKSIIFDDCICGGRVSDEKRKVVCWFLACAASSVLMLLMM